MFEILWYTSVYLFMVYFCLFVSIWSYCLGAPEFKSFQLLHFSAVFQYVKNQKNIY